MGRCLTAIVAGGLLFAVSGAARADVTIDGGDVGGQVWTAGQGPYHVTGVSGDVMVPAGKELRIEAGTVVLFSSDPAPAQPPKLSVSGTLTVAGTAGAPVILQAAPDATRPWGGIWAGPTTGNVSKIVMTGAIVRKAAFGLWLPRGTQVGVSQTTVEDCTVGITVEDGTYVFDGITVQRNGTGIDIQGGPSDNPMVTISDSVITGNTSRGVNVLSSAATITNCTVDGNGTGVNVGNISSPGSVVTVVGSIISNNVRAFDVDEATTAVPVTVQVTSTTFWNNTDNRRIKRSSGYESLGPTEAVPGDGNGVADPKYVGATDLHLTPGSPCVDSAGMTGGTQDRDGRVRPLGAAMDRGAYELDPNGGSAGAAGGGAGGGAGRPGGHAGGTAGGGNGGSAGGGGGAGARGGGAPGGGGAGASEGEGGARGGAGMSGTMSGGTSGGSGSGSGGAAGNVGGAPANAASGGGAGRAAGGAGGGAPPTGKPADGGCGCTMTDLGPNPLALVCAALVLALRARPRKA